TVARGRGSAAQLHEQRAGIVTGLGNVEDVAFAFQVAEKAEGLVVDETAADDEAHVARVAGPGPVEAALELVERLVHRLPAVGNVLRQRAAVALRVELILALGTGLRMTIPVALQRQLQQHAAIQTLAWAAGHGFRLQ